MKGKKEKKDYDQNIGLHEVFLESVPTVLIVTVIFWLSCKNILIFETVSRVDFHRNTILCLLYNIVTVNDRSLDDIMFGEGTFIKGTDYNPGGFDEFLIAFFLSVFSASLGLAKCLKNGVARPIGDGGCLDGLLSCRHLLAFFACALCLVARGAGLGIVTGVSDH